VIPLERRDGRPLVIGHRGAAALAPENTLRALRAAHAAGVDLIEFDVLALRSGELVLAHSNDLREVSHGSARGRVRDMALAELREAAPELATLEDALRFFANEADSVGIHLDLKSVGVEHEITRTLSAFGLVERALVSSFKVDVVRRLGQLEPDVRTCISFPEDRLKVSGRRGSRRLIRAGLRSVRPVTPLIVDRLLGRSNARTLALEHSLVSGRVVDRAHRLGARVIAWTVETPDDLARVERAGVDAVVVNDPGMFGLRSE
jgi:glycerophosphoryl diester phosphodiesterase